jgi:cell division septum initiation protein DivIVA
MGADPARKEAPMSVADVGLFGSQDREDLLHPEFTRVLKGYDPEQVETFIAKIGEHVERLDKELRTTMDQLEATQRRYSSAREEAYGQVAAKMAEVIRTADQQADRIRRETEEQSVRRVSDAEQQAAQIRREAETDVARLRQESEELVGKANSEGERILGGISSQKVAMLAELRTIRKRLIGVVDLLESAAPVDEPEVRGTSRADRSPGAIGDAGMNDLLGDPEGFDLVLPEILSPEDEE